MFRSIYDILSNACNLHNWIGFSYFYNTRNTKIIDINKSINGYYQVMVSKEKRLIQLERLIQVKIRSRPTRSELDSLIKRSNTEYRNIHQYLDNQHRQVDYLINKLNRLLGKNKALRTKYSNVCNDYRAKFHYQEELKQNFYKLTNFLAQFHTLDSSSTTRSIYG